MNLKLKRIVSMLTRLAIQIDGAAESPTGYDADIELEYKHEYDLDAEPERWIPTERASWTL